MLIGIDPILTPDLLRHLRAMGHGDQLVIVDANFPAESSCEKVERLAGVSATQALRAILSVMPLDTFVDDPARTMQVVGNPDEVPDIVKEFKAIINETADNPCEIQTVERHAFYREADKGYCIVQTAEERLYGNIILSKGIVPPKSN